MIVKYRTEPMLNQHQFQTSSDKNIDILQEPLFNLLIKSKLVMVCYV